MDYLIVLLLVYLLFNMSCFLYSVSCNCNLCCFSEGTYGCWTQVLTEQQLN
jgi:hypothetical protein